MLYIVPWPSGVTFCKGLIWPHPPRGFLSIYISIYLSLYKLYTVQCTHTLFRFIHILTLYKLFIVHAIHCTCYTLSRLYIVHCTGDPVPVHSMAWPRGPDLRDSDPGLPAQSPAHQPWTCRYRAPAPCPGRGPPQVPGPRAGVVKM